MKKLFVVFAAAVLIVACGPEKPKTTEGDDSYEEIHGAQAKKNPLDGLVDPTKGIGQVTAVTLNSPLEQERIGRGKAIFDMKCSACHRLDEQRVVGPGWKNVTKRRKPEWIMNMVTNVDMMLDKDEEAQKLLELCLMRMPNQNVSIGDARDILEFMRQNDGDK